jgi:hypothetical protein
MNPIFVVGLVAFAALFVGFVAQERAKNKAAQARQPRAYDQRKVLLGRRYLIVVGVVLLVALVASLVESEQQGLTLACLPYLLAWVFTYRGHIWARVVFIELFGAGVLLAGGALLTLGTADDAAGFFALALACQGLLLGLTLSPSMREYVYEGYFRNAVPGRS